MCVVCEHYTGIRFVGLRRRRRLIRGSKGLLANCRPLPVCGWPFRYARSTYAVFNGPLFSKQINPGQIRFNRAKRGKTKWYVGSRRNRRISQGRGRHFGGKKKHRTKPAFGVRKSHSENPHFRWPRKVPATVEVRLGFKKEDSQVLSIVTSAVGGQWHR